jgi:hypothetical protein
MHDKNLPLKTLYCRAKKNEITKEIVKISIQFVTSFSSTYFSFFDFYFPFVCMHVCMHNSMRRLYLSKIPHFLSMLKRKSLLLCSLSCFTPNKKCLLPYLHIMLQAIGSDISSNQCNPKSHKSDGSTVLSLIQLFILRYRWVLMLCLYFSTVWELHILPNMERNTVVN